MSKLVSYTFPDGVIINGTADQIIKHAKLIKHPVDPRKLGMPIPRGHYYSSTKGIIAIKNMESKHIINSLNRMTIAYYTSLKSEIDNMRITEKSYLEKYVGIAADHVMEDLYTELMKRQGS